MNSIIFVRTRHNYESYTDFWRLVELAQFPTIYVDQLDISKEGVYIVSPMNGEWRPHLSNEHKQRKPVNAHLILWNLERPSGSAGSVGEYAKQCRHLQDGLWENGKRISANGERSYGRFIDEVWVSDARMAEETHTRFVILGSHEGLGSPGEFKQYDFCHMSYETGRRQTIYKEFDQSRIGGEKEKGKGCWGDERDKVLRESFFALNVHQDQHPFQEPLRFALFAAYGLPIISENCFNGFPWAHDDTIIFNGYNGLVGKVYQMLAEEYGRWRAMGLKAREMMTVKHEFGKMVRQAVRESVYKWR